MSLDKDLENLANSATAEVADKNGPQMRAEWDGTSGFIETGRVGDDFNPENFSGILQAFAEELHYDPSEVFIAGKPTVVVWETGFRNKDGEWEKHKHHSWRYRLAARPLAVDLPALYAEIRNTDNTPANRSDRITDEATIVVCWGDLQVGKVDHLGGLKEQLERLQQKREALEEYLWLARFNHIVVCDVGDILEGFENVASQQRTNSLSLQDQVQVASIEFWKTIALCAKHAPVDVLSIPSNHCQWRKGKSLLGVPGDDWGLHISRQLEWHNDPANGGPGLPVTFHRPATEWDETLCFDVRGTRLGLAHGHQASRPDNVKTWWEKVTHGGVLDCHVLVTGHFHFASLRPHGRDAVTGRARWHIQCPTLDNGSAWVRNKMGEDGDPALAVFRIDENGFDLQGFGLL